jgi:hypothetical protein
MAINSSGHIFAGTYRSGVFRSTDNGDSWTEVNNGLTNMTVLSLVVNAGGHIFAGTDGGGIFRSVQSTTSVKEITSEMPTSFSLEQNYPNPFNSETMISYQLSKSDDVILKIYNIIGQEIRSLVDERQQVGYYTIRWDGRDDSGDQVSSGLYFYTFIVSEFTQTKKALLIR